MPSKWIQSLAILNSFLGCWNESISFSEELLKMMSDFFNLFGNCRINVKISCVCTCWMLLFWQSILHDVYTNLRALSLLVRVILISFSLLPYLSLREVLFALHATSWFFRVLHELVVDLLYIKWEKWFKTNQKSYRFQNTGEHFLCQHSHNWIHI